MAAASSQLEQLHVSLSRTVAIRFVDQQPLLAELREALQRTQSFRITLDGLASFRNDTGTRSFLSILVREGRQAVCDLVQAVDRAFAFLGLQTFHQDPKPHVSLAWALSDCTETLQHGIEDFGKAKQDEAGQRLIWQQQVEEVLCTIGKRRYRVWPYP